jgi:hypothetical protein
MLETYLKPLHTNKTDFNAATVTDDKIAVIVGCY